MITRLLIMKTGNLIAVIGNAAQAVGYSFQTGIEEVMPAVLKSLPAVWLMPPAVKECKGRARRRGVYKISMRMIMLPITTDATEVVWSILEENACELYERLIADPAIRNIKSFKTMPSEKPVTKNGAVALSVEFETEMIFYNTKD